MRELYPIIYCVNTNVAGTVAHHYHPIALPRENYKKPTYISQYKMRKNNTIPKFLLDNKYIK